MQITETQIAQVNNQIQALLKAESFYGKKLEEAGVISTMKNGQRKVL